MEALTTIEQWGRWAADEENAYNRLPYVRRYPLAEGEDRVLLWRRAWEAAAAHAFVLESGKGGRYTFLGLRPSEVIRGKGTKVLATQDVTGERTGEAVSARTSGSKRLRPGPLATMREQMGQYRGPEVPGAEMFLGGWAGYLSYDVARSLEKLPTLAEDDLDLPDYIFMRMDELWIIDHEAPALYIAVHLPVPEEADEAGLREAYALASTRADAMKHEWDAIVAVRDEPEAAAQVSAMKAAMAEDQLALDVEVFAQGIRTSLSKEGYQEAVRRIQAYIGAGDVFQVNLSLRQSLPVATSPEELYEWLRAVNPSPYMGFMKFADFSLVSASPELLVKQKGSRVSMRPIAGTRRRGRTPEEDAALAEELLASIKERAEHIMLVDLARNDLGRIAAYGTVHVPELLTIEPYSHVMHLVSQVEGTLAPGADVFDVLAASFPGGTITGAPKIRTMEIIEELEPVRRAAYTGSLGWIDYAGNMEFNIIIRTMVAKDGICHIQAGAGIVIDSDPEREFYECLNKAKALWKAVQYGERLGPTAGSAHVKEERV